MDLLGVIVIKCFAEIMKTKLRQKLNCAVLNYITAVMLAPSINEPNHFRLGVTYKIVRLLKKYFLQSILVATNIDVSRHILVVGTSILLGK
jgi:hypothetical protein